MGKGDQPRPRLVSTKEYNLRWDYAEGKITLATFNRRYKALLRKERISKT